MQPHLRRRTEEGWTLSPLLITGAIYRRDAAAAAAAGVVSAACNAL